MQYEIDYLSVGNGKTSGDAIGLRFGDISSGEINKQWVVVIDGGFKETGDNFVKHIRDLYRTNTIDLMISTHPDRDHASGLSVVLNEMDVRGLLMHKPWEHPVEQGKWTSESHLEKVQKAYSHVLDLHKLATGKNVPITEPFAGTTYEPVSGARMTVLGPSYGYYGGLLANFEHNKSLEAKILERVQRELAVIAKAIKESLDRSSETLDQVHKNTSAENNSSAILHFDFDGQSILLTADAGVEALHNAADYAIVNGIDLSDLNLFGVPHHGSKHSVDGAFLDRVGGTTAFISATQDSKKHPSQRVVNALHRRNFKVFTTEKGGMRHHSQVGPRPGWSTATPRSLVEDFSEEE